MVVAGSGISSGGLVHRGISRIVDDSCESGGYYGRGRGGEQGHSDSAVYSPAHVYRKTSFFYQPLDLQDDPAVANSSAPKCCTQLATNNTRKQSESHSAHKKLHHSPSSVKLV